MRPGHGGTAAVSTTVKITVFISVFALHFSRAVDNRHLCGYRYPHAGAGNL
jgi:hypothetical protein